MGILDVLSGFVNKDEGIRQQQFENAEAIARRILAENELADRKANTQISRDVADFNISSGEQENENAQKLFDVNFPAEEAIAKLREDDAKKENAKRIYLDKKQAYYDTIKNVSAGIIEPLSDEQWSSLVVDLQNASIDYYGDKGFDSSISLTPPQKIPNFQEYELYNNMPTDTNEQRQAIIDAAIAAKHDPKIAVAVASKEADESVKAQVNAQMVGMLNDAFMRILSEPTILNQDASVKTRIAKHFANIAGIELDEKTLNAIGNSKDSVSASQIFAENMANYRARLAASSGYGGGGGSRGSGGGIDSKPTTDASARTAQDNVVNALGKLVGGQDDPVIRNANAGVFGLNLRQVILNNPNRNNNNVFSSEAYALTGEWLGLPSSVRKKQSLQDYIGARIPAIKENPKAAQLYMNDVSKYTNESYTEPKPTPKPKQTPKPKPGASKPVAKPQPSTKQSNRTPVSKGSTGNPTVRREQ